MTDKVGRTGDDAQMRDGGSGVSVDGSEMLMRWERVNVDLSACCT
jgi:hypothetical protein